MHTLRFLSLFSFWSAWKRGGGDNLSFLRLMPKLSHSDSATIPTDAAAAAAGIKPSICMQRALTERCISDKLVYFIFTFLKIFLIGCGKSRKSNCMWTRSILYVCAAREKRKEDEKRKERKRRGFFLHLYSGPLSSFPFPLPRSLPFLPSFFLLPLSLSQISCQRQFSPPVQRSPGRFFPPFFFFSFPFFFCAKARCVPTS